MGSLVGVALFACATASVAQGAVACGQVITEDTTLTTDLVACTGDGLIIGAPNVTLDLNGHSIRGAGVGTGVLMSDIADHATIKNGEVSGFDNGIFALSTNPAFPSIRLESMRVIGNVTGVHTQSIFCTCGQVTIESSRIERNSGPGVHVIRSSLTMTDSSVRRNGAQGVWAREALPGRFERNDISNNGDVGLFLDDSFGSMIDNRMSRNGGNGFVLRAIHPDPLSLSFAAGNEATGNGALGFFISSLGPWESFDGGGNIAKGNGDPRECLVETTEFPNVPPVPPEALVCYRNKG
jgi:hypothetical protein